MIFNIKLIENIYQNYSNRINEVRVKLNHALTLSEKILYTHLHKDEEIRNFKRGVDYINFTPDRVVMQDATAQMTLLQFMTSDREKVVLPTTIHCDHLIQANASATEDIKTATIANKEVYDFLRDASNKYDIGFWEPGSGIIHQVILENYAFPGGLMIGTDSHTPNAGGLSMLAVGVGGSDAVDVMVGMPWELRMPRIIGVKLTGSLSGWTSAKDVILKLAGILTVNGGTDSIIEYFGEGTKSISATGKATICNMGAEIGATSSIFPYDEKSAKYLKATGREDIVVIAEKIKIHFAADEEVLLFPEKYYDQVIEIDLDKLEPYVNGPYTPDAAYRLSELSSAVEKNDYPRTMEVGLIGSCTNSSYEDMLRASSVLKDALNKGLELKSQLRINPGSELIRYTLERDGILKIFEDAGAIIMANACGPCIGQWKRINEDPSRPNSIMTSFNRNFSKRNDGNPNTHAFVASPEIVVAFAIAGNLMFNPMIDTLVDKNRENVKLSKPEGDELPQKGFEAEDMGYIKPSTYGYGTEIKINPYSERIQLLDAFSAWDRKDMIELSLLIKVKGKCTTDHISMAGPWLKYRGHLDNISNNMFIGAVNAYNNKANSVLNPFTGRLSAVPDLARELKAKNMGSIVVAEENYGEGSSREHAAMEPRHLNVKVILVKSFARIHETNLKKQGLLALTFANPLDYDKIREDDKISVLGLKGFKPDQNLIIELTHSDGAKEQFEAIHTYNNLQIMWFIAGSSLNYIKHQMADRIKIINGKLIVPDNPVIPFIEGDGIGKEIWGNTQRVIDNAVKKAYSGSRKIAWKEVLAGEKSFNQNGTWLPEETLQTFKDYLVGIKGPLTTPVGGGIRSLNVALRLELDLYVCLRPVRWLKGVVSPLKEPEKVNMTIFRENTEDIYVGIEWMQGSDEAKKFFKFLKEDMQVESVRFPETSSFGVKPVSIEGTERLVGAAIEYALDRKLSSVTLVHKGNIMKYTEGGFRIWGYNLAEKQYGDKVFTMQQWEQTMKKHGEAVANELLNQAVNENKLIIKDVIADAFLQNTLLKPEEFSVIATLNLNGDYISDQLAAMVGGVGIAPGANINYKTGHAIFEATHGTAPRHTGKNTANPSSLLLSSVMMMEYIGWKEAGELINLALKKSLLKQMATDDLARFMKNGKSLSTSAFCDLLIKVING